MKIENEIWKKINIDCDNKYYEISNMGNVRKINKNNIRLLKNTKLSSGYLVCGFNNKNSYVHRLVAETFIPNTNNKKEVNHIDGNKSNNKVSNLEWVTRAENLKHARDSGLVKTKVTKDKFKYIVDSYKKDNSYENIIYLSNKFEISVGHIERILRNGLLSFSSEYRESDLSKDEIKYIYENVIRDDKNFSINKIAKQFNISPNTVSLIVNNKTYVNITKNLKSNSFNVKNKREKIPTDNVIDIYENTNYNDKNLNPTAMAKKYNIKVNQISNIINGKNYYNITKNLIRKEEYNKKK